MMVEDIIKEKGLDYKLTAKDLVIKCLNPEHDDTNPSMHIDKVTGIFHCWSCGYSGSLHKYYGMDISILDARQQRLLEIIRNKQFNRLEIPSNAIPYTGNYRGISSNTYKDFNVFLSSDFENRLVFPIYNISDDIVVFQARSLVDEKLRYITSPRHIKIPLYPAKITPKNGTMILVEGLFDMLRLYDHGFRNVVCMFGLTLGVSGNYIKQKDSLKRLEIYRLQGVTKIILMTDGDAPGRRAAEKMYKTFSKEYLVDVVELPEGKDPGSLTTDEINHFRSEYYA